MKQGQLTSSQPNREHTMLSLLHLTDVTSNNSISSPKRPLSQKHFCSPETSATANLVEGTLQLHSNVLPLPLLRRTHSYSHIQTQMYKLRLSPFSHSPFLALKSSCGFISASQHFSEQPDSAQNNATLETDLIRSFHFHTPANSNPVTFYILY
mmetsp:Transcript_15780/g.43565  ORF Transcript_15780/g.43565 Transcript_15780/m.43565 type:complete len:153 (-) Transcript_15780:813-1271(-)